VNLWEVRPEVLLNLRANHRRIGKCIHATLLRHEECGKHEAQHKQRAHVLTSREFEILRVLTCAGKSMTLEAA
jgi:DNA-binding NarL/FixJ family response regulator